MVVIDKRAQEHGAPQPALDPDPDHSGPVSPGREKSSAEIEIRRVLVGPELAIAIRFRLAPVQQNLGIGRDVVRQVKLAIGKNRHQLVSRNQRLLVLEGMIRIDDGI